MTIDLYNTADVKKVRELLTKCDYKDVKEQKHIQLIISGF
jgi:hypothetical protein